MVGTALVILSKLWLKTIFWFTPYYHKLKSLNNFKVMYSEKDKNVTILTLHYRTTKWLGSNIVYQRITTVSKHFSYYGHCDL